MPQVRICPYCKRAMMKSTYQMINHIIKECKVFKKLEEIK